MPGWWSCLGDLSGEGALLLAADMYRAAAVSHEMNVPAGVDLLAVGAGHDMDRYRLCRVGPINSGLDSVVGVRLGSALRSAVALVHPDVGVTAAGNVVLRQVIVTDDACYVIVVGLLLRSGSVITSLKTIKSDIV